jgi:predicted kinase
MKQIVYICKGLPGSGKTTWAKQFIENCGIGTYKIVRICNDDIREEISDGSLWTPEVEKKVRKIRMERIERSLKDGDDVIVDNTHINPKTLNSLKTWLKQNFPDLEVIEKDFSDVPVDVCIDRDKARELRGERFVGPEVILKMAYEGGLIPEIIPYPVDPELPWTIICDLDGTLALFGNRRSPYDASYCDIVDEPNPTVLNLLKTYHSGCTYPIVSKIHFFSGRENKYRDPTQRFLSIKCGFSLKEGYYQLVMRTTGDKRPDEIIKKEFFEEHIRGKFNVFVVIDDRPKVIRMWKSLGLPVFNVGDNKEF